MSNGKSAGHILAVGIGVPRACLRIRNEHADWVSIEPISGNITERIGRIQCFYGTSDMHAILHLFMLMYGPACTPLGFVHKLPLICLFIFAYINTDVSYVFKRRFNIKNTPTF